MKKTLGSNSGAALVIAVAAAAVVLLSASLLLGYLGEMVQDQNRLEAMAQARLTEASAADWVRAELMEGRIPDGPVGIWAGGMTTELTPGARVPLPPLAIDLGSISPDCPA